MAYLSLWLAGKLRCFDGHGHPWKAVVSVIPTGLAVWIGITRLQVSGARSLPCSHSSNCCSLHQHEIHHAGLKLTPSGAAASCILS